MHREVSDFRSLVRIFRRKILGRCRLMLLRSNGSKIKVGSGFYCGSRCYVSTGRTVSIGENFYMGNNCQLSCNLQVGDYVMLASGVAIVGGDHKFDDINGPMALSGRADMGTTVIEDDVWVGHGSIILDGLHLKKGCIVAAGSVVTRDIPENAIYGGNPARLIRMRSIEGDKFRK